MVERARLPSWRMPFSMATSPPVTAMRPTTGDRQRKWTRWPSQKKVYLLSNGLTASATRVPTMAVTRLMVRTTRTDSASSSALPLS